MKEKLKKTLYEYTANARITTKELGKRINASQQSASYLIKSLKKNKQILGEAVIVDAVKLGYFNTLIGFNYVIIDDSSRIEILEELKKINEIVGIEESKEGVDLLVEFSTKNLAALDKCYSDVVNLFEKKLSTVFIFPIITRYKMSRKYLKRIKETKTKILFGDREIQKISENEKKVLDVLLNNTSEKVINISEKVGIGVKSVTKAIKELERKYIIKGYEAVLNHEKLKINRYIIFLRFSSEGIKEIKKFIDYARAHKNIIEVIKTLGSSQVVIVIEDLKEIDIIKDIRKHFLIQNYMIFKSLRIHKRQYLPFE